jgi:cyclopropane fatty-acyl-phospholipid synthase-like methyltransferase
LDLGTGPGTFAIEMAKRKFHVIAVDISASAIKMAMRRAGGYAAAIEWVTADLFSCNWPNRFQLIHDRGVYHSLPEDQRKRYASLVPQWLRPGGVLVLKTFHQEEPGNWGPNRIHKSELSKNFGSTLETVEIAPSVFPGTMGEPKAWRAVFRARRPPS